MARSRSKATRSGSRRSSRTSASDVVVSVEDNGIGITPEDRSRIFDMFVQGSGSPEGAHRGGLGIGLTLAKRLVEMHGGTLSAFSEGVGTGSRFDVRLSARPSHAVDADGAATALDARPSSPGNPVRVLVVDDNVDAAHSPGSPPFGCSRWRETAEAGFEAHFVLPTPHPSAEKEPPCRHRGA
jgi:hypothetical protein